eukprot:scaffold75024_cov21-Tisochrysis_lutea.AAC.1
MFPAAHVSACHPSLFLRYPTLHQGSPCQRVNPHKHPPKPTSNMRIFYPPVPNIYVEAILSNRSQLTPAAMYAMTRPTDHACTNEKRMCLCVLPEFSQALRQQAAQEEAAAAAAAVVPPNVVNTPASVEAYVERVMQGALQEGQLPEVGAYALRTTCIQLAYTIEGLCPTERYRRGSCRARARACVLLPGQEPLSLEGFLAQERALDVTDAQHIANKLLYDATNEALTNVYKAANRVKVWGRREDRPPALNLRSMQALPACNIHAVDAHMHLKGKEVAQQAGLLPLLGGVQPLSMGNQGLQSQEAPLTSSRKRIVKPMPGPEVLVAEVKKQ